MISEKMTAKITTIATLREFLEPDRLNDFDRPFPVQRLKRVEIRPVLAVNDIDIVSGSNDPSETGLPADLACDGVELKTIDERYEWIQLHVDVIAP